MKGFDFWEISQQDLDWIKRQQNCILWYVAWTFFCSFFTRKIQMKKNKKKTKEKKRRKGQDKIWKNLWHQSHSCYQKSRSKYEPPKKNKKSGIVPTSSKQLLYNLNKCKPSHPYWRTIWMVVPLLKRKNSLASLSVAYSGTVARHSTKP